MAEEGENIKVAVRVRPFNRRERERGAKLVIRMKGPTTTIVDPEDGNEKHFTFDFSYWSFNGSKKREDGYYIADDSHENGEMFAGQKRVCDDMATSVLDNAWSGFNATLFAYGQTGSGKSYSVVGYGINKGIVPVFCEEIFKGMEAKKASGEDPSLKFEVTFSMLEIYAEKVRDLLVSDGKKQSLRIRQHPKKGFYAQAMKKIPVSSYAEIEHQMEVGVSNRTVAATKMNATSSRAHTIVGITFVQRFKNAAGAEVEKKSVVNLVDLAGSERADSTGATGQRLKEGAAINTSLSALGNVIAALADKAGGKRVKVPYRDSVLTKLLMNALGGNSKTLMVAAISPADINYEESLSTLRYADRAKQIKTVAVINEDPTEKLIRELQQENARLKKLVGSGGKAEALTEDDAPGMDEDEREELRKELEEDYEERMAEAEAEMEEMKKTWEEKLKSAQEAATARSKDAERSKRQSVAHLWNLNVDPMLNGKIVHFLDEDKIRFGGKKGNAEPEVVLRGPGVVSPVHAIFSRVGDAYFVEPGHPDARILVNGKAVPPSGLTDIGDTDRIQLGHNHLFVMANPSNPAKDGLDVDEISWEMAQGEISRETGLRMEAESSKDKGKTKDEMTLLNDISELIPAIEEANGISEDMDKKVKFELALVTPKFQGLTKSKAKSKACVKMRHLETEFDWILEKAEFFERLFVMREMFDGEEEEGEMDANITDPFWENPEEPDHVGSALINLESLTHLGEIKEQFEVIDYKGKEIADLEVEAHPVEPLESELLVLDPNKDLVGKKLSFDLRFGSLTSFPSKYKDVTIRYKSLVDTDTVIATTTQTEEGSFSVGHDKSVLLESVSPEVIKQLQEAPLHVQIWAKQKAQAAKSGNKTTKQMIDEDKRNNATGIPGLRLMAGAMAGKSKSNREATQLQKRNHLLTDKIKDLHQLARIAEGGGYDCVPISVLNQVLNAGNVEASGKIFKEAYGEDGSCKIENFRLHHTNSSSRTNGIENHTGNHTEKESQRRPRSHKRESSRRHHRRESSSSSSSGSSKNCCTRSCAKTSEKCSKICSIS